MVGLRKSIYWVSVSVLMVLCFVFIGTPIIQTVYFLSFLLPVVIISSYYFNTHLIPNYLSTGKYWLFSKYTVYTIIFALYAQAIIFFLSLLLFSNFQTTYLNSLGVDLFSLGLGTLLVILINAFHQSFVTLNHQKKIIENLKSELLLSELPTITIKANRQNYHICLDELIIIESRGDYVQLHTVSNTITTKERISKLATNLPRQFVRTHRSFIVNKNRVQSYNKNRISIDNHEIPISRTYKNSVLQLLDSNKFRPQ